MRFTGERDASGHADRFWSAALCREAKGNGKGAIPPFSAGGAASYDERTI